MNLNWKLIAEVTGGILFVMLLAWFFFFRSSGTLAPATTAPSATTGFDSQATAGTSGGSSSNTATNIGEAIQSPVSKQKVFKISDGPIAGAAFMQDSRPTTTIVRYVMQQNGHVLDLAIDSPGSVARAISNTTIPGAQQVTWERQRDGARSLAAGTLLQYLDQGVIKTVLLSFPQASSTATSSIAAPVRIQFLPNGIASLAVSPDGKSIAYLMATAGGSDGYVAHADGTSPKKLFSLPLSQVVLSWPSASTLMATSKAAAGVAGIAFSINASSGAMAPLLYAAGLSTTADPQMNTLVYQSVSASRATYAHDTKSNLDRPLSFDPIPEKCVWSQSQASTMYCAVPLSYVAPNYLDLWHQGATSAADSVVAYNLVTGKALIIAKPGGTDGGVSSDVAELSLSADDKYLLFIKKGDRSLWGVRIY